MVLSPFLNLLIARIGREGLTKVLAATGTIWVVIPTLGFHSGPFTETTGLFIFLYLLAAYLRSRGAPQSPGRWGLAAWSSAIVLISSCVTLQLISPRFPFTAEHIGAFTDSYSLLVVFCAFSTLRATLGRPPVHRRAINVAASAAFGVYLIHENPLIRNVLWTGMLGTDDILGRSAAFTLAHMFASVAAVYIGCTLLELIRLQIVQRPFEHLVMIFIQQIQEIPTARLKEIIGHSFVRCVCWLDKSSTKSTQK